MGIDIYSFAEVYTEGRWCKFDNKVFPSYGEANQSCHPFTTRSYMYDFLGCKNPIKGLPADSTFINSGTDEADYYIQLYELQGFNASYLTVEELEKQVDKKGWLERIYGYLTGKVLPTNRELLEETDFFEVLEILQSLGNTNKVRVVFYFL